jgi:hypothetical protein
MPNEISSSLQLDVIMEAALTAFQEKLLPLTLFSTVFNDVPLQGSNKAVVPYYPLVTAASKNFDGSYVFDQSTKVETREVEINQRKYQTISYTSSELRRQPYLNLVQAGQQKGRKLAEDVLTDIFGLFTVANYGAKVAFADGNFAAANSLISAYSAFDTDDVIDISTAVKKQKWPSDQKGRGLILPSEYLGNVQKDIKNHGGIAAFGVNPTDETKTLPVLNGFSLIETNIVPDNGENLVGMAVYPSAALVAFSPVTPAPDVMAQLTDYRVYTDPESGITIEARQWGDPKYDTTYITMEANYGRAVGEKAALFRIFKA